MYAHFNPAGDLLVTGGWTGRLRLWNPYTGREVHRTTGSVSDFGPGDRLGAPFPGRWADGNGPLTVAEAGREYRTVVTGVGRPAVKNYCNCSVHRDGRLLAVATLDGLSLVDLATGSERAFVPGFNCAQVLFEPDGSLLTKRTKASAGLFRWPVTTDPADPGRLRVGPPETVPVTARSETIACSAEGGVLAAADFTGAFVWDRDRPLGARYLNHGSCRHVAVSRDGKLVATGTWGGRGIKVWDASSGQLYSARPGMRHR